MRFFTPSSLSTVLRLIRAARPSAIARLVVSVVVDSFDGVPFGTRPHVLDEVTNIVKPSLADADASISVVLKGLSARVVAACLHTVEDAIFPSLPESMDGRSSFCKQATTAFGVSRLQVTRINQDRLSTRTPTRPPSSFSFHSSGALGRRDNCKPSEDLPYEVEPGVHALEITP